MKVFFKTHLKRSPQSQSYPGVAPERCGGFVLMLTFQDILKTKDTQVLAQDRWEGFVLRLTFQDLLKAKVIQVVLQTCVEPLF